MRILRAIPAILFGLMFAGGGVFFLSVTALPVWQDWHAMKRWHSAQAALISVQGGENYTRANYRYEYNGTVYERDRVYIADFNDNIGPYHKNLYSRLKDHQRTQSPITVWVDPANPGQSVIDRDMRWGLFALMAGFCSIFVLVGVAVAWGGITSKKTAAKSKRPSLSALRKEWQQKQRETPGFNLGFIEYSRQRSVELAQEAPGKQDNSDWQLRKGWETPNIRSGAKQGLYAMWGFAVLWSALSSPLLWVVPEEVQKGNYAGLVGALFPLIGLFLIYKAISMTREYRRFGKVLFEMDPYPGAIGGNVGGRIKVTRLDYGTATAPTRCS